MGDNLMNIQNNVIKIYPFDRLRLSIYNSNLKQATKLLKPDHFMKVLIHQFIPQNPWLSIHGVPKTWIVIFPTPRQTFVFTAFQENALTILVQPKEQILSNNNMFVDWIILSLILYSKISVHIGLQMLF